MVSHRAHREHGTKGKRTESLPENICAYANIFRQHYLSLSVSSVRSSSFSERVRNASAGGLPRLSSRRHGASSGFSLVEVTLALLVVAIGMLSILGMFPAGLDQNARSISDTHAAMFAEEIFSSLRVHAETNWQGIGNNTIYPVAASTNWHTPLNLDTMTDNLIYTNVYRHPSNSNIVDHAFRYRITLATNGLIKSATLRLWPGEFGKTNNPLMFYSEFYQMNR